MDDAKLAVKNDALKGEEKGKGVLEKPKDRDKEKGLPLVKSLAGRNDMVDHNRVKVRLVLCAVEREEEKGFLRSLNMARRTMANA